MNSTRFPEVDDGHLPQGTELFPDSVLCSPPRPIPMVFMEDTKDAGDGFVILAL